MNEKSTSLFGSAISVSSTSLNVSTDMLRVTVDEGERSSMIFGLVVGLNHQSMAQDKEVCNCESQS